jgi:excisionase family DNA binding protein
MSDMGATRSPSTGAGEQTAAVSRALSVGAKPVWAVTGSQARSRAGRGRLHLAVPPAPGQVFADLLLLGALACQAPVALLSVPQLDGTWSTLTYGLDAKDVGSDGRLFSALAASDVPVAVADLEALLPLSPLVGPPHSLRWAYGVALRRRPGSVLGAVVVLDHWVREVGPREERAVAALARQLGAQLDQWKRLGEAPSAPTARPVVSRDRSGHPAGAGLTGTVSPPTTDPGAVRGAPSSEEPAGATTSARAGPDLLRSQEVAEMFNVTDRTVINWAAAGKLPSLRTIGGHLRFRREDVLPHLAPHAEPPTA